MTTKVVNNGIKPSWALKARDFPCTRQYFHQRLKKMKEDIKSKHVEVMVETGRNIPTNDQGMIKEDTLSVSVDTHTGHSAISVNS